MDYITNIFNEEFQKYKSVIMNEGTMTNIEMLAQAYNQLLNGIQTYTCARNEDAGLRDPQVEATLRRGLNSLQRQYDRELESVRKQKKK